MHPTNAFVPTRSAVSEPRRALECGGSVHHRLWHPSCGPAQRSYVESLCGVRSILLLARALSHPIDEFPRADHRLEKASLETNAVTAAGTRARDSRRRTGAIGTT